MHTANALAAISSLFLFISSTGARVIPTQPPPHVLRRGAATTPALLDDKCTFILFQKQVLTATSSNSQGRINYIQVNNIIDHTNDIVIDVAAQRPQAEHNSYVKVNERSVFAVEGLLDGASLIIHGSDGEDELKLESGGWNWSTGLATSEDEKTMAWCQAGEWAEAGNGSRERSVECAFHCERIEEEEAEREELR
ncbi:hypothetical protein GMOD_00005701 [Pyrenophora seminiperda CCB06]|uniref:Uncharacterized protein n=1 Tax=Pyrenophora seminiperda CCB06 TaxID=1302712 RepID=A0A3M7M9J7_9PLEO|nr:hypothetical protein GMOD_00005701 [Pyrenophora seminiperda CCB06]